MVKYVTKQQYQREEAEYMAWVMIIKTLTFGKVDFSKEVEELMSDKVIINI